MKLQYEEFLEGVVGVVEATSYESMKLWETYHKEKGYSWVQNPSGPLVTVGWLMNDRPVCISLFCNTIKGHKILFLEATSILVDWEMINVWLKENLPKTAFQDNGVYVNKVTSSNFHNVFPRD